MTLASYDVLHPSRHFILQTTMHPVIITRVVQLGISRLDIGLFMFKNISGLCANVCMFFYVRGMKSGVFFYNAEKLHKSVGKKLLIVT